MRYHFYHIKIFTYKYFYSFIHVNSEIDNNLCLSIHHNCCWSAPYVQCISDNFHQHFLQVCITVVLTEGKTIFTQWTYSSGHQVLPKNNALKSKVNAWERGMLNNRNIRTNRLRPESTLYLPPFSAFTLPECSEWRKKYWHHWCRNDTVKRKND